MIKLRVFTLLTLLCCLVQACTLSVPQVGNTLRQIGTEELHEAKDQETIWLASFRGRGAMLRPYITDGYTVFANEEGDAVAFDGWVVRSVLGFGSEDTLTVSDDGWLRSSTSAQVKYEATCTQWQRINTQNGYQWLQNCGWNGHQTVITVDDTDNIVEVVQSFGGDLGVLKMSAHRQSKREEQ